MNIILYLIAYVFAKKLKWKQAWHMITNILFHRMISRG